MSNDEENVASRGGVTKCEFPFTLLLTRRGTPSTILMLNGYAISLEFSIRLNKPHLLQMEIISNVRLGVFNFSPRMLRSNDCLN